MRWKRGKKRKKVGSREKLVTDSVGARFVRFAGDTACCHKTDCGPFSFGAQRSLAHADAAVMYFMKATPFLSSCRAPTVGKAPYRSIPSGVFLTASTTKGN